MFESDTKVQKEAYQISNKTAEKIELMKRKSADKIEDGAEVIVKKIL
jgi:hypothetical protein